MGVLDGPIRSVASSVLDAAGATVTLIEPSGGSYDPASGTRKGSADTRHEVSAVIEDADARRMRDETSPQGEKKVTVAAQDLDVTPNQSWSVEFGDVTWEVRAVDEIRSGDEVALYELWVEQ